MSDFLIPHPPASIEQMEAAVIDWRRAAAHERFCVEHNLCAGWTQTAIHNAELYEKTAREIEKEIELRKSQDADVGEAEDANLQPAQLGLQFAT